MRKILIIADKCYLGIGNRFALESFLDSIKAFTEINCELLLADMKEIKTLNMPAKYDLIVSWNNSLFFIPTEHQKTFYNRKIVFLLYDFPIIYYLLQVKNNKDNIACWQKNQIFVYDRFFVDIFKNLGFLNTYYLPLALDQSNIQNGLNDINLKKDINVSYIGTLLNPFGNVKKEKFLESKNLQAFYNKCLETHRNKPLTPYWKTFLQCMNSEPSFNILIESDKLTLLLQKFMNFTAYDLRFYYIKELSKEVEITVFSQNEVELENECKVTFDKSCVSRESLINVYSRSKISLNFNHTQITDSFNQRFFAVPFFHCHLLSLQIPAQHDLFEGYYGNQHFFKNKDELIGKVKKQLENPEDVKQTEFQQIITDNHLYKHRWQQIFKLADIVSIV